MFLTSPSDCSPSKPKRTMGGERNTVKEGGKKKGERENRGALTILGHGHSVHEGVDLEVKVLLQQHIQSSGLGHSVATDTVHSNTAKKSIQY